MASPRSSGLKYPPLIVLDIVQIQLMLIEPVKRSWLEGIANVTDAKGCRIQMNGTSIEHHMVVRAKHQYIVFGIRTEVR